MELTCKICNTKCPSTSFAVHFNLNHRLSSSSRFTCGVPSCFVQFVSEERFKEHLWSKHVSSGQPSQLSNEETSQFSCPVSNCNYKCNVKSTLRVHRKRKHGQETCAAATVESEDLENMVFETHTPDVHLADTGPVPEEPAGFNNVLVDPYVENIGTQVSRPEVVKKVVHLYLSLNSLYHVPDSTIQFMVDSLYCVANASHQILKDNIFSNLRNAGVVIDGQVDNAITGALSNDPMLEVHGSNGPLRSSYMRHKTYRSGLFRYVAPKSLKLGLNEFNVKRTYHIVSIKDTLVSMFEDDSVYEQYLLSQTDDRSTDGFIRDLIDGTLLQNHPILSKDKSAIGIVMDADDLEVADALGSAKGNHKTTAGYFTLTNLKPWSRMKKDIIKLFMVVPEKDVAYFGLERVLDPIINELSDLAETGIEIRGQNVKVVLVMLLGDNLGTHTWTGLVENFSRSKFFCRYCEQSRDEWCLRWHGNANEEEDEDVSSDEDSTTDGDTDSSDAEDVDEESVECVDVTGETSGSLDLGAWNDAPMMSAPMRTPQSYDRCLAELQSKPSCDSVKGVVGPCQLNKLKDFHWVGASPPCIAHDLFEGVIAYDVPLCLKYLKTKFGITAAYINSKITSLKLHGGDQGNKPAKVKDGMKKLRGSAVQNWTFLRFLPMIIRNKVTDTNDAVFQMILLLAEITRFLTSPAVLRSELPRLKEKIHLYLKMRCFLFPHTPLRAKHHFLEHYPDLIERFGCLMRVNTLGCESKHRFLKNTAIAKKNFKNITKTLSEEHQLAQSAVSVENLTCNVPLVEDTTCFMSTAIKDCATRFLGEHLESATCSEKVRFHGTWYRKGELIVLNKTFFQLCLIEVLLVQGHNCFAVGWRCEGALNKWQLLEVTRTTRCVTVNLARLDDYSSYPLYANETVVLKHATKLLD